MRSLNQGASGIAGLDEVGRGALFGPVVAAAVVLTADAEVSLKTIGVRDSKCLKAKQREALVEPIKMHANDFAIGLASVHEIDRLNILNASLLAMKRAASRLHCQPQLCCVDGNQQIPGLVLPQQTVIKGDQTVVSISAASILAKVWRDALIVRLDQRYPGYDLASNKGYGSARHREAIARMGLSPQHRKSFRLKLKAVTT